jgi:hypothetical protein
VLDESSEVAVSDPVSPLSVEPSSLPEEVVPKVAAVVEEGSSSPPQATVLSDQRTRSEVSPQGRRFICARL